MSAVGMLESLLRRVEVLEEEVRALRREAAGKSATKPFPKPAAPRPKADG